MFGRRSCFAFNRKGLIFYKNGKSIKVSATPMLGLTFFWIKILSDLELLKFLDKIHFLNAVN